MANRNAEIKSHIETQLKSLLLKVYTKKSSKRRAKNKFRTLRKVAEAGDIEIEIEMPQHGSVPEALEKEFEKLGDLE